MDGPPAEDPSGEGDDRNAILRVSLPWPAGTKNALLTSLDRGTFEDIRIAVRSGPESTEQPMYFARAVGERVGNSISRRKPSDYHGSELMIYNGLLVYQSEPASQPNTRTSLLTLVTNTDNRFSVSDIC